MIRYAITYISIAIEFNFHRSQFARFRVPMQQDENNVRNGALHQACEMCFAAQ
jgi:hypothetical protein